MKTILNKEYNFYNQDDSPFVRKKYSLETIDNLKATYHTKSKGIIHQIYLEGLPEIIASDDYQNHTSIPKVTFITYMSPKGYIEVEKSSAKFTQSYERPVTSRVMVNTTEVNQTDIEDLAGKVDIEKVSTEEVIKPDEQSENVANEAKIDQNSTKLPKYEYITKMVTKYRNLTKPINYTETFIGHQPLSEDDKISAFANLVSFTDRDKIILDTFKAKNDFEALIYSSREWVSDEDNQIYSLPKIIEEFNANLTAGEDWLYEDGYDETLEVYLEHIDKINSTISAMKFRKEEHLSRDNIINSSLSLLNNFTSISEGMLKRSPWIQKSRMDRLSKLAKNTTEWMLEKIEEQSKLELYEDPILTTDGIRDRMYRIGYLLEDTARTPKPKGWGKKMKVSNSTLTNSTDFNNTVFNSTTPEQNFTESDYKEAPTEEIIDDKDAPIDDL